MKTVIRHVPCIVAALVLVATPLFAQDGPAVYRAACASCAHTPAFAAYSLPEVTAAMVQAKAAVLASGIRLDSDGSRQLIEAQALKLLRG